MPTKYKVVRQDIRKCFQLGDIVYSLNGYDYGLAADDTHITGIEHITVSCNEDGGYPGITIPAHCLEIIG